MGHYNYGDVWDIEAKFTLYGILGLNRSGRPMEWDRLSFESGLKSAKRKVLENGHEGCAVVPILLRLPDIGSHLSVYNLAGTAETEVAQVTYPLFDPGRSSRPRTGSKLKAVHESWPRLSRDAKEAIEEIVLFDNGVSESFNLGNAEVSQ